MSALLEKRNLPVELLFERAGLPMLGTKPWGTKIDERGPGVYVVSSPLDANRELSGLNEFDRSEWIEGQEILYIGRSKHVRRRLIEFYRHVYGAPRPHRGGQALLQLECPKTVSWAAVADYAAAEHLLIETFREAVGRKPFANRVRAARMRAIST